MVMTSQSTFIKLGNFRLDIMVKDGTAKNSLKGIRVLDVGGRLGVGLGSLSIYHSTASVAIEQCCKMFEGSINYLCAQIKKVSLLLLCNFITFQMTFESNI